MVQVWVVVRDPTLVLGLSLLGRSWDLQGTVQLPAPGYITADVLVVDAERAPIAAATLFGPSLLVVGVPAAGLELGPGGMILPEPATIEDVAEGISTVLHDRASEAAARRWARVITLDDAPAELDDDEVQLTLDLDAGTVTTGASRWQHRGAPTDVSIPEPPSRGGGGAGSVRGKTRKRPKATEPGRVIGQQHRTAEHRDEALSRRLGRVLFAATELEALLAEFPLMRDRQAVTDGVVAEAVERLELDTAAVWDWIDGAWRVVSCHGLTVRERHAEVDAKQPLFSEVHTTGGGVLIERTERLVAAVYGIGGAHTASLAAAAIAAADQRYGIVCIGRDRPLDGDDLDLLIALARDAAPGLATARLLERLSPATNGLSSLRGDLPAGDSRAAADRNDDPEA